MKKAGEVYYINLNPVRGREQKGHRPYVVVSGNTLNSYSDLCIVSPLTTSLKYFKGGVIIEPNAVNGLKKKSEILVHHVRTIEQERLKKKIGVLTEHEISVAREGLILYLQY